MAREAHNRSFEDLASNTRVVPWRQVRTCSACSGSRVSTSRTGCLQPHLPDGELWHESGLRILASTYEKAAGLRKGVQMQAHDTQTPRQVAALLTGTLECRRSSHARGQTPKDVRKPATSDHPHGHSSQKILRIAAIWAFLSFQGPYALGRWRCRRGLRGWLLQAPRLRGSGWLSLGVWASGLGAGCGLYGDRGQGVGMNPCICLQYAKPTLNNAKFNAETHDACNSAAAVTLVHCERVEVGPQPSRSLPRLSSLILRSGEESTALQKCWLSLST